MTVVYLIAAPRSSFEASNGDPATGKLISIFSLQVNIFHLLKRLFSDYPSTPGGLEAHPCRGREGGADRGRRSRSGWSLRTRGFTRVRVNYFIN